MLYTRDTIKYLLLTWDAQTHSHIEKFTANPNLTLSGLFNWSIALNGERGFPRCTEQFEKYNIVHLNITSNNLPLISKLKRLLPDGVKLLLNVDHAIDLWGSTYVYPDLFLQEIDRADYIFAVEPLMAHLLSTSLKRNVPCLPHPVQTVNLKPFRQHDRSTRIALSVHRYDQNWLLPYFAFLAARLESNWITRAFGCSFTPHSSALYDEIIPQLPFDQVVPLLADCWCAFESYTIHSYGRLTIECAALGVPVIGADCVESQKFLFPDLCYSANDMVAASKLLRKITNEPGFQAACAIPAIAKSEHYSMKSCSDRLLDFLNSSQ